MPKRDVSQKALWQVEEITGSKPVRGETLLRSRKLKKQNPTSTAFKAYQHQIPVGSVVRAP